ncbi:MAG: DUF1624 domain-containing protein [Symploca sp. SIO2E6]|nr:DUF1624 domain-containing protein [Symploca sp. SIO2E6]
MTVPDSTPSSKASSITKRLVSIDLLRGLVMLLMALDHVRGFFSNPGFNPLNIDQSNLPLFFTRWVTHLCAPSFILLVGISAYLALQRKTNKKELSRFLLIRGVWLIFLDLIVISLAWTFYPGILIMGVLWVIGWSMIILAALIHLPLRRIAIIGIMLIVGHNLFDGVQAENFGSLNWFWSFLHEGAMFRPFPGIRIFLGYPLIPWVGVTAVGYALGKVFSWEKNQRLGLLRNLGCGLIGSFLVIRGINIYGDPQPWSWQSNVTKTILSFINCHKYPPSLTFLLITLGLALLLLYFLEKKRLRLLKPLSIFGQVPLFFYIIHLWLIHLAAIVLALPKYGLGAVILPYLSKSAMPADYGYSLHHVYLIWLMILIILYPLCYWFAHYKSQHKYWWLSYL